MLEELQHTPEFHEDKFKELVLYIAERGEDDPTFGVIKLNKELFFSDFLAYAKFGEPITGAEYIKLDHGPAPKLMSPIREEMEERGDIVVICRERFGFSQKRVVPRREPDLSAFTAQEIALVSAVIEGGKEANATEFSDRAHKFLGWKIAAPKEVIPYQTIFLSHARATAGDEQRACELAKQHGW